jgi:hypothetical protein
VASVLPSVLGLQASTVTFAVLLACALVNAFALAVPLFSMLVYDKAIGNFKTNLAPFFPDKVELTLSKASDLPVRVVYLKNQINPSGNVAGETPILSLEFRDYRFEPLPPETFRFQLPSGREEIDQTEEYLDLIKKSDDAFGGKSVAPPAAATP